MYSTLLWRSNIAYYNRVLSNYMNMKMFTRRKLTNFLFAEGSIKLETIDLETCVFGAQVIRVHYKTNREHSIII